MTSLHRGVERNVTKCDWEGGGGGGQILPFLHGHLWTVPYCPHLARDASDQGDVQPSINVF